MFYYYWWQDIRYYRSCSYFSCRIAPDVRKLQLHAKSDTQQDELYSGTFNDVIDLMKPKNVNPDLESCKSGKGCYES